MQIKIGEGNWTLANLYTYASSNCSSCGFHHVLIVSPNLYPSIYYYVAKCYPMAMDLIFGEMRVSYMDSRQDLGCMVEFYQDTPDLRDMYARVAEAAQNWDGSDPVRAL